MKKTRSTLPTSKKLLYLRQILEEYTDADHGISMDRILELLSMRGIKAERKSIYEDIDVLINDLDMDIQRPAGRDFTYRLNSRLFDIAELKLIIDSVQSSKFLSEKSSREIIKHLSALCSRHEPFVGTPKTKSGFREVPIIPDLLAHLLPLGEKGFIVSGNDPEKPLTLTAFRCMMKRINASVDLHGATSHVFRHTIGTMLNDTGADVKTIQSILGQSDFKTTMDRYVHARDNKKQEAIKNVSLLLQN